MKNNLIANILSNNEVEQILVDTIDRIYQFGTDDFSDLEILSYIKMYQPQLFSKYEQSILYTMGLFFKNANITSFRDLVFDLYKAKIKDDFKESYTPIQANIIKHIENNRHFSFSSPTSTGKSFVFRHIIKMFQNDIVIIVPSRALINEYFILVREILPNKDVNILTFVDLINTSKVKKNVFIITPERTKDLFRLKESLHIDMIMFDEAQLSNDASVRGLYYDSVIRRCVDYFPDAKIVFAYPFVDNPEVQYVKNKIDYNETEFKKFNQRNVGQMFYCYDANNNFYHFGLDKERLGDKVLVNYDPVEKLLRAQKSILIYCSKKSIYDKTIFTKFLRYMDMCEEIRDETALKLIAQFRDFIGASKLEMGDYSSQMVERLKRGIVVHHGSLPLQARYILEEFTKKGYCKICFATSTLEQGINMPFDMVWIERFEPSKPLNVKNIIGRAGRSTRYPVFDYGQVVIKETSRSGLRRILKENVRLEEVSQLDKPTESNDDYIEYKNAIKNNEFSEEYNLTNRELARVETERAEISVKMILDNLFEDGNLIIDEDLDRAVKFQVYDAFRIIYECYLNREVTTAEKFILDSVVKIMLWKIIGKSFSQIVWYRYSHAARTKERKDYKKLIEATNDLNEKYRYMISSRALDAHYLPMFQMIPNKNIPALNLTYKTKAFAVDYDRIVVDTYDYLDKLIGFRLGDAFFAAFDKFHKKHDDKRAEKMCNYIKFGTNNKLEIMLLRYGFNFEEFEWLKPIIKNIDETGIEFKEIDHLSDEQIERIKRFL